jgi:hypothetical protein
VVKQPNLHNITIQQNNNLPIRCYKDTEKIEKIKSKGAQITLPYKTRGCATQRNPYTHTFEKVQTNQASKAYLH